MWTDVGGAVTAVGVVAATAGFAVSVAAVIGGFATVAAAAEVAVVAVAAAVAAVHCIWGMQRASEFVAVVVAGVNRPSWNFV